MHNEEKPTSNWKEYEKIAAQIYKTLSPHAEVKYNDKIYGESSKQDRQIDVSIRQNIGAHSILIIVQCRDHRSKIDINAVGELSAVVNDVRANMGVIVSNSGFTGGAVNLAKDRGIQLCSLYDAKNKDWKDIVKIPILCVVVRPVRLRGRFDFSLIGQKKIVSDANKMEFVKQNGESKGFSELFVQEWNAGKISGSSGQHTHQFLEEGLQIRSIDGSLVPVGVSFIVEVATELRFGYLGISGSKGIVNMVDNAYTTTEIITDWVDIAKACNEWKLLSSEADVPQKPLVTMNARAILFPEILLGK